jgi:hypothetical protein
MVAHFCNPSTWDAKARGSQVQVQPELHSKMLLQKKTTTNIILCSVRVQEAGSHNSWILNDH